MDYAPQRFRNSLHLFHDSKLAQYALAYFDIRTPNSVHVDYWGVSI